MDKNLITDSEYLFALCITDGLLEEMDERERSLVLLAITNMKGEYFKEETTPQMRPNNSLFELNPITNRFK